MEQGLSFIVVVILITIGIWMSSPLWVLTTFLIGGIYLLLRGRKKGWIWRRN